MRFLIAGAGIGGLALAIALRRNGEEPVLIERAAALEGAGSGITLHPNGMAVLAALGLDESVQAEGAIVRSGQLRDPSGKVLSENPLPYVQGHPVVAIHRKRLHQVLASAARGVETHLGVTVRAFEEAKLGVVLRTSPQKEIAGHVLVGADGIHSAVRVALLDDGPPQYAGYTSWRGVCEAGDVVQVGLVSETWGRGERFGIVPLADGEVYWFATANAAAGAQVAGPHQRFAGWHDPIPELLKRTPEKDVIRTDIADRPRTPRWSFDTITLLGDAAHPMTPNFGQGASQALEDVAVLTHFLKYRKDATGALINYERERLERVYSIVDGARRFGAMGQWEGGPQVFARNLIMRFVASMGTSQYMKMATFEVPDMF